MRIKLNGNKGFRLLSMYEKLNKGELLKKAKLAVQYSVCSNYILYLIYNKRRIF